MFAEAGVNSRLDSLQAAFLRVKLKALERWNRRRAAIAEVYLDGLSQSIDIVLPQRTSDTFAQVWHIFCIRHPDRDTAGSAPRHLWCLDSHPLPDTTPSLGRLRPSRLPSDAFPVTNAAAATVLSLPMGPHLGDTDVGNVIDAVLGYSAQLE